MSQLCVGKLNYFVFVVNKYLNFTTGKLWSRSLKLAYTLLNKLGTKTEPVLQPGDRVRVTPVAQVKLLKSKRKYSFVIHRWRWCIPILTLGCSG